MMTTTICLDERFVLCGVDSGFNTYFIELYIQRLDNSVVVFVVY